MKHHNAFTSISILLATLLTGCNSEPVNDVSYYVENAEQRKAKLKECRNNPGELKDDPNCLNAQEANRQIIFNPNKTSMPSID